MSAIAPGGPLTLEVEDLCVSYGLQRALVDVSAQIRPGEVLAVLGANGAGKSTLARSMAGLVRASSGHVRFEGADITRLSPHRIARSGLTYIPEGRGIFPTLSVVENLRVALSLLPAARKRSAFDEVFAMFPILATRQNQRAGTLSGGEQQMLALARAFASDVKLLIVDELSLGLAPKVVQTVFESLEVFKSRGISLLVIEQFVAQALHLADSCLILQRGRVAWSGPAEAAGVEVRSRYLGQSVATAESA